MKPNQFNPFYLLLLIALFVSSCGGGSEKKSDDSNVDSEFDAAKKQLTSDVQKVIADLPPPSEVPYLLMSIGAEFDTSLINSIDKVSEYEKNKVKAALNLGIYGVDIAYLSSYEKSELALEFMNESQKLADPIGVADAIDLGMVARFEKNMENKDSLASITNDIMKSTGDRLGELQELESAALLLAGSWIEGVYISASIVKNYPDDLPEESRTIILEPIIKVIVDQKPSLDDILKVLSDVPQSESITTLKDDLTKVKEIYDGQFEEVEKEIAENTGDYVLAPETLDNLTEEITKIRTFIVQ